MRSNNVSYGFDVESVIRQCLNDCRTTAGCEPRYIWGTTARCPGERWNPGRLIEAQYLLLSDHRFVRKYCCSLHRFRVNSYNDILCWPRRTAKSSRRNRIGQGFDRISGIKDGLSDEIPATD